MPARIPLLGAPDPERCASPMIDADDGEERGIRVRKGELRPAA